MAARLQKVVKLGLSILGPGRFRPGPPRIKRYVPDTWFTSGTDHMVYSCRSHPPIMNCPLKGRFIYWGFVIPALVNRRFKRRLFGVGAWNVV